MTIEKQPTVEQVITRYFEEHRNEWKFAGTISDYIRSAYGKKAGTTERVLRFMERDKTLEHDYEDTGHGKPNVKYRLNRVVAQSVLWK